MSEAQKIPDGDDDGDDIETEQLRAAVEEARAAARRGDVVLHEQVREWLLELAQDENHPSSFE